MPSTICQQSNFLYNLFHTKSQDLSANEQKKFKKINIVLACTTFGIGHALCGLVYLIQSSCKKTSKTQKVAQNQLNLQNKGS